LSSSERRPARKHHSQQEEEGWQTVGKKWIERPQPVLLDEDRNTDAEK
jgi:hypothetical protein